ncbi:LA2681 family HEPN domain-containing protein [Lutibacter sp. B1]|uniref:LA2681 family HEPN domain-containing protein n=1 Tax=Lutibacter sp. B1 TaxID=2725996 RepID=UPI00145760FD|nr:LA2681 family HEPN domain-containing protein [Lutibacter sp. B1]NLP59365.1 tetratricopeptide repeat protein [Lutibacter sp. B1]
MDTIDFSSKKPKEIIEIIGANFESAKAKRDLEKLQSSIKVALEIDTDFFDTHSKAILHYFIGNAWSYIQNIKYPLEEFPLETYELEQQIICLRKAYSLIKECNDKFNTCQILTNLGSLFSHIGRFSEAQEYFNLCLNIDRKFGMAIGNRGFAMYYYARVIFEPTHQFIFMQYARKDLLESQSSNQVYLGAKNAFKSTAIEIEKAYPLDLLNDFKNYGDNYKKLTAKEREYREWCAINRLFINPLNDILTESVVANDYLFTPSMILRFDEKPIFHSLFNQLKQEFVSARFLFYEALNQYKPHFSDKEVVLMDTLDYSVYSFTLEKVKITFRVCYSLFDKIAYFINLYLKLGQNSNRVSFRNIWYKQLNKSNGLNERISTTKNWAMRGLFWLSKDLYETEFDLTIEPEAKEIATIRNFVEHKAFKIVESFNNGWSDKSEIFEIDRSLFYDKTFKLLKLSRSALMYLSFLIYDEERERKKLLGNKLTMPMEFIEIQDDEKI